MRNPASSEPPRNDEGRPRPTIVGIGASAGGLDALKRFFSAVPGDSGLAWVVVVHLPPDRESHLADLLQPHAQNPVIQVRGSMLIEPDHVYVIPPGRKLSAVDSHLHLDPLETRREDRSPVDHFFDTLAEAYDGHAVAVVLTGTGSDGTHGIRRIRGMGGIVIVQDPDDAEFDGMPRSALATGVVDLVLPVAEIPPRILELAHTRPEVGDVVTASDDAEEGDRLPRILTQVHARTGQDFSRYKRSTIQRRIERRMQLQGVERLPEYLRLLRESADEAAALADDLLINVTSFFRDRAAFEHLERDVVPRLFEGRQPQERVRIWSVGCATGEEAYSLGMLLLEEASRHESPPQIQVFASDLHERSLRHAREGLYPETIADDVSGERLARFFVPESGSYRVRKELREIIVFAPHNLLRDPPFSHLDLVCCRNLLIYLQRDVQDEVIELFHYALRDQGYLLLGTAETVDRSDLFRTESREHHLYRRRNVARLEVRLPSLPMAPSQPPSVLPRPVSGPRLDASFGTLHQRMVERFAPPSMLVGADHSVLHLSESAGRYLQVAGGPPSSNVFRLVREELRMELRAALHLAGERQAPTRSRPIPVRIEGERRNVVLRVSPAGSGEAEGLVLVIFDEATDPGAQQAPEGDAAARELETELETTRGRLQALVEEFETSQEEMRASNEEMQSANEELRSTMEELETSREELQSINEELQTVNQENRHKVEELSQLSSDLQNLLKSTDVATIFLDRSLRILRFTPRVAELFNIRSTDRGRPLADLTHRLGYGGLLDDSRQVLATLIPVEREVRSEAGRWYLVRVMPYRTVEDRIDGVVITLVDVSRMKQAEEALRTSEGKYRSLFESIDEGFCIIERIASAPTDFRYLEANPAFAAQSGISGVVGRTIRQVVPAEAEDWLDTYTRVLETRQPIRFVRELLSAGRTLELYAFPVTDHPDERVAVIFKDITERRRQQERQAYLLKLSDTLRPLSDAGEIQESAMHVLAEHLHVARAFFFTAEQEPEGGFTHVVSREYRRDPGLASIVGRHPNLAGEGDSHAPLVRGERIVVPDTRTLTGNALEHIAFCNTPGVRSFLAVPLVKGERYAAALGLNDTAPREWTNCEIELAEETAERAWAAVGRSRAEEALHELNEMLERSGEERTRQVREQEDRFRTLVETSSLMVWSADATGQVVEDSGTWRAFTGQTLEQRLAEGWLEAVHPDDRGLAREHWLRSVADRSPINTEFRIRHAASGSWRWTNLRAAPLHDQHGEVRGWISMNIDIDERRQAELARADALRQLASAEEQERRRISRELHDRLGQQLTGLQLGLRTLQDDAGSPEVVERLRVLERIASEVTRDMHDLAVEIRPAALDSLGLAAAVQSHLEAWGERHNIMCDFHTAGLDAERLPAEVETTLYRIMQEGLINVLRHASASRVSLVLEKRDGTVRLILEDDGSGFDVDAVLASPDKAKRLGVRGMRERVALIGGTLQIESSPAGGTTLFVRVPVDAQRPADG